MSGALFVLFFYRGFDGVSDPRIGRRAANPSKVADLLS